MFTKKSKQSAAAVVEPPAVTGARERANLDERVVAARARLQEIYQRLQDTQYAAPPRAELAAGIERLVARCGSEWLAVYGHRVVAALNPHTDPAAIAFGPGSALTFGWLCASQPDVARANLASIVEQIDFEPGPAIAEHEAAVAALRRELAVAQADVAEAEAERSEMWSQIHGKPNGRVRERMLGGLAAGDEHLASVPLRPIAAAQRVEVRTNERGLYLRDSAE